MKRLQARLRKTGELSSAMRAGHTWHRDRRWRRFKVDDDQQSTRRCAGIQPSPRARLGFRKATGYNTDSVRMQRRAIQARRDNVTADSCRQYGQAHFHITNGGVLTNGGDGIIGNQFSSNGIATVDGVKPAWTKGGFLIVADTQAVGPMSAYSRRGLKLGGTTAPIRHASSPMVAFSLTGGDGTIWQSIQF